MAAGSYILRKTYVDGDILAASDYIADHQQHIDNQDPQHTDDYSLNIAQMRTYTDPGDVGSESLATTLAGEIERLRYAVKHIKEKLSGSTITQWYSKSYSVALSNGSVTTAKLADGATFVQYLRAVSSNVAINNVSDTVLVSQAITMTRTRVRIGACVSQLGASGVAGTYQITFKLKRGTVVVATQVAQVPVTTAAGGEAEATRAFFVVDAPGTGTFTYSVTAISNSGSLISTVGDYQLSLEEVA
jgi:hypothetical protein